MDQVSRATRPITSPRPAVRGVDDEIDLTVYPPPDLAVEVVATHEPRGRCSFARNWACPSLGLPGQKAQSLGFLHPSTRKGALERGPRQEPGVPVPDPRRTSSHGSHRTRRRG